MSNKQDFWTLAQIYERIKDATGVEYSLRHLYRFLKQMGMFHYKPEPLDYRRPKNAELIISERLRGTIEALKVRSIELKDLAIGFADESCSQANCNKSRLWSFFKKPRKVNTTKLSCMTFGFYAIKGKSKIMKMEGGKATDIQKALNEIKEANKDKKGIIVLWDNARSHLTKEVQRSAWEQNIFLIQLPAYSPDLNPIERIWWQIKKAISKIGLIKTEKELEEIVISSFSKISEKVNCARKWLEDFWADYSEECPILN